MVCTFHLAIERLETRVSTVFQESVVSQLAASMLACLPSIAGERRCTRPTAGVLKTRVSMSTMELGLWLEPGLGPGLGLDLRLGLELRML